VERRELVSPRTRRAFREHLVGWPLRAIEDLFENEGIQPGSGSSAVTGQRRSLVERYYASVDWASPQEVRKVLRAYEHVLAGADLPAETFGELKRHLEWDGYTMDATGRLRTRQPRSWMNCPWPPWTTQRPSTSTSTASDESWTPTPPRRSAAPEP
jgi:hypothetical protein